MGIIAGIYYFKEADPSLYELLTRMCTIQRHRDSSKPIRYSTSHFGAVMSNRQNHLSESNSANEQTGKATINGIAAFVDGIVLDVPKHMRYFRQRGYHLSVSSGSSVIAAAYKEWGKDFREHLEGEFACAVWDEDNEVLLLSRDPYGHKPLHYAIDHRRIIFSSEAKGILVGGVSPEIDLLAFSDYLSLNCIPHPATIFKHIRQVSPGETMIISRGRTRSHVYWVPRMEEDSTLKLDDAVNQVSDSLRNAVKKRMVGDEAYCFLSGGVDSSMVLSYASELSHKTVNAITIGFDESETNELPDAVAMARHVGAKHHHVTARAEYFFDMLETLVFHHDSPFTDTSAYPSYYAGMLGRQFTDIILTGDGPDQTMAGSSHHVFAAHHNIFAQRNAFIQRFCSLGADLAKTLCRDLSPSLLSKVWRNLDRRSFDPIHAAFEIRSYFPNLIKESLCEEEVWRVHLEHDPYRHPRSWFSQSKTNDPINQYLFADIKFYIPEDLMVKVDRMCMAHGLETLSPFQDVELASIVSSLPSKYKLHISPQGTITTKYILMQLAEHRFPPSLLNKKKQGFAIPVDTWLRQNDGEFLKNILLDPRTLNRGYFKKKQLEKYVHDFLAHRCDFYYACPYSLVSMLTFELWHRLFVDDSVKVPAIRHA